MTPAVFVIPDYSSAAAKELEQSVQAWVTTAERLVNAFDKPAILASLQQQTQDIKHTSELLKYSSVAIGLGEVFRLLNYWSSHVPNDTHEAALVLLQIGDQLQTSVAMPVAQARQDSALSWLPIIDNCRSCRQEAPMAKAVVAAAGIALPQRSHKPMPARSDCEDFITLIKRVHKSFTLHLVGWFKQPNETKELAVTATTFLRVADACDNPSRVSELEPLFRASGVVLDALAEDPMLSSFALQRLLGRLERYLRQLGNTTVDGLPQVLRELPTEVLQQLLYYVARFPNTSNHTEHLRRAFGLDVLSFTTSAPNKTVRASESLRAQVIKQLNQELDGIQAWLDQAATDPGHPQAQKLFKRLNEQVAVSGLLGFQQLQWQLQELQERLLNLSAHAPQIQRLSAAEQLLRVRAEIQNPTLDQSEYTADAEVAGTVVGDVAQRLKRLSRRSEKNQFHAMAASACLRAVQVELCRCEADIVALLEGNPMMGASAEDIAQRLDRAAKSVSVLPQPEVIPLLNGLADALRQHVHHPINAEDSSHLAELLVALDLYIDSLLSDSQSLTPLLQHAVQALEALQGQAQPSTSLPGEAGHKNTDDEFTEENTAEDVLDAYLQANEQITPWLTGNTDDYSSALAALEALRDAAQQARMTDVTQVTTACVHFLKQPNLPNDAPELVNETMAVVPQMLHAEPGTQETVRGLDTLLHRLSLTSTDEDPLDNTLQTVFVRECASHIDTLRQAVKVAKADIPLSKLPSDALLRALHTLSGCAQTVSAEHIVSIVQPLQKAALALQRSNDHFSTTETDYIDDLADALEARLDSFQHHNMIDEKTLQTERELPDFVTTVLARSQPDVPPAPLGLARNITEFKNRPSSSSGTALGNLASIFRAEADDLMLRLRSHAAALLSVADAISGDDSSMIGGRAASMSAAHDAMQSKARENALKVLHTLKGSARMAGNHAMADAAHDVESDVSSITDASEFGHLIRAALPRLQDTLTDETSYKAIGGLYSPDASQATDTLQVDGLIAAVEGVDALDHIAKQTDNFANALPQNILSSLLDDGNTLVSRQAQVDDQLGQLNGSIRDLQSSADRLKRLASNNPAFDAIASRELVADIQAAHRQLENAFQDLQRVQSLASQSGTALHRALVRSGLNRVDSLLPRLNAALSDAKVVCGVDANLLLSGGETPVSVSVLKSLAPLLEHLVRNAVAHGFSSPESRKSSQKPIDGEIALSVRLEGSDLLVEVSDDGDGIDEDALNQKREENGLAPISDTNHLREILCSPGFSTLDSVNAVAGRGQGLATVLDGVEALGGNLELINDPGEGLTVCLRIPQLMVVARSLVFGSSPALHALPLNDIQAVIDFDDAADKVVHNDQEWPVLSVETLMGVAAQKIVAERCALINMNGDRFAIPLPKLQDVKELIVQPLGTQLTSLGRYVGGAVLSDGHHALILNVHRLIQGHLGRQVRLQSGPSPIALSEPAEALIADDSITMRVAGERLLNRLGFKVHTARDGLEALDFLKRRLPSVLLLDIEMPGVDGFDVVRRMRPELVAAEVPVIMISTRKGPAERDRARSLGVQHLIHKPYTETQLREALEEVGVLSTSTKR